MGYNIERRAISDWAVTRDGVDVARFKHHPHRSPRYSFKLLEGVNAGLSFSYDRICIISTLIEFARNLVEKGEILDVIKKDGSLYFCSHEQSREQPGIEAVKAYDVNLILIGYVILNHPQEKAFYSPTGHVADERGVDYGVVGGKPIEGIMRNLCKQPQ